MTQGLAGDVIMARGLDHVVHAVSDLESAADFYRRLGFTVGARNQHPWGTHNRIVQFPGLFIELLTFAEPEKLGTDGFSKLFAAYNRDFISGGDGLSLLVLESKDAAADEAAFRAAGIAQSDAMRFERAGKRPDGSDVKVAFSLAFAKDAEARGIHFCTCQQHYPENFWNPAYQRHPNGTREIRAVVAVADDPEAHRDFASTYTGSDLTYVEEGELSFLLPRGALSLMTPKRFRDAFGGVPFAPRQGAQLAALRFAVADITKARAVIDAAGVPARSFRDGFVIDDAGSLGAAMSFEPLEK